MWVAARITRTAAHTLHAVVLAARLRGCARTRLNVPAPAPQSRAKRAYARAGARAGRARVLWCR
eukprot:8978667-Alexandrium_andersonii.AAC.1